MSTARLVVVDEGGVQYLHDDDDLRREQRRRAKGGIGQGKWLQRSALRIKERRRKRGWDRTAEARYKATGKKVRRKRSEFTRR